MRIGGAVLLTWITFQVGFAIAGPSPFVPQYARRMRAGAAGAFHGVIALGVVVAVVVLAALAPTGAATGKTLRVAIVQGGGPQGTHATDVSYCAPDGTPNDDGPLTGSACVTQRHLVATRTLQPSERAGNKTQTDQRREIFSTMELVDRPGTIGRIIIFAPISSKIFRSWLFNVSNL